jgi:hypothetical protein
MKNIIRKSNRFGPTRIIIGLMVMFFSLSQAYSDFPETMSAMDSHNHHANMIDAASEAMGVDCPFSKIHTTGENRMVCNVTCDNVCSSTAIVWFVRYAYLMPFVANKYDRVPSSENFSAPLLIEERPPRQA